MGNVLEIGNALVGRGYNAAKHVVRTVIAGEENKTRVLPAGFVKEDGSLDLYDDVKRLFRLVFDDGKPAIQCGGWIGYIPLNDQFALEVAPKVPIGNLERIIGMAAGYSPSVLQKYTRHFGNAADRPEPISIILADQLLDAFDRIWDAGLLKTYNRCERIGSSPTGRIDPFASAWRTAKAGRPVAVSSSFQRNVDFGPNRLLLFALEKLFARYFGDRSQSMYRRLRRCEQAISRLADVTVAQLHEVSPEAVNSYLRNLPVHHEHYADALLLAQLIVSEAGLSIRNADGLIVLPSILIDMSKVFESYVRRVLANYLELDSRISVKDGNAMPPIGSAMKLFEPYNVRGRENPAMTPDIVIEFENVTRLVIDVKYKPERNLPDRGDTEQAVTYGARYECNKVMLLHAGRSAAQGQVNHVGNVGIFSVYNGLINLNAENIEKEEFNLAEKIRSLL
ncbi:5-methylcytosine restriction system specificity protein McrC [Niveispirillum sp. KHB5.9]|uniref:5-methylcytosine restriction system specificity protein McrC n=1 Tax=Niveispirillum sp. KHB5.9 TaxID=3400269 RepID=UPI003A88ECC0